MCNSIKDYNKCVNDKNGHYDKNNGKGYDNDNGNDKG